MQQETMGTKTAVHCAIQELWREKLDISELKEKLLPNEEFIPPIKLIGKN